VWIILAWVAGHYLHVSRYHFLESRFPDSRRKAYYLMAIHDAKLGDILLKPTGRLTKGLLIEHPALLTESSQIKSGNKKHPPYHNHNRTGDWFRRKCILFVECPSRCRVSFLLSLCCRLHVHLKPFPAEVAFA
jgi:hypothetical protein